MTDSRRFRQDVITPAGVSLGGSVDLEVREDGTSHVHFHMHGSSFLTSYDFALRAYLKAPGFPTLALVSTGHTSGVDDWNHEEDSSRPLLAPFWPQLAGAGGDAKLSVQHDWGYSGVIGTFDDLVKDVVEVGGGAVGGALGVIIGATADAVGWMGMDLGPGGTLAVIGGVVVFAVAAGLGAGFGGALVMAVPAGAVIGAVTEALIDRRDLNQAERDLAYSVFGGSLDPNSITLTNLAGIGGRAFTAPGVDGRIYVNLGARYENPSGETSHGRAGQLLIHELTHAWQIQHETFLPGLMCSGIVNQAEFLMGDTVYDYGGPGRPWGKYNAEQQAAIVDQWFGGNGHNAPYQAMDQQSTLYRYVYDDVLGRAAVSTARGTLRTSPGSSPGRTAAHVDVFWIQPAGEVGSHWWDGAPHSNWGDHPPFTISGPGAGVPGQQVSAVARDDATIDVFWAAANGSLWTASWAVDGSWVKPRQIAGPGAAMPGASVAATSRADDQLDVFWIAPDGAVWSTWWNGTIPKDWDRLPTFPVTDPGAAQPGAGLAAVGRRADHLDLFWVGNDGAIGSTWWDAAPKSNWSDHKPFPITPAGAASRGSQVAAVTRTPDHVDVFWIGPDGAVASQWWDSAPHSNWGDHPAFTVTPPGVAHAEGGLAAVARTPEHVDVFYVGYDGAIGSAWWDAAPKSNWGDHPPFAITPPDAAQHGSPVSAVTRTPAHVDVFWVGHDGAIQSTWWDAAPKSNWADHAAFAITGAGVAAVAGRGARASSGAAVSRTSRNLDVFWADADGAIASNWWASGNGSNWGDHPTFTVTPDGSAQPFGPVATVSRAPDQLDVFWIAPDGAVWSTWWHAAQGMSWLDHVPFQVAGAGSADPAAPVVAAGRTPGHLDVFWIAPDGAVRSHWWDAAPGCGWDDHPSFEVAPKGAAVAGGGLAAMARTPFHLDAFWVGPDGAIGSNWWDGAPNCNWDAHPPFQITPPGAADVKSRLSATARNRSHVDVFWVGTDGAIGSTWWDTAPNSSWADHGAFPITKPAAAAAGAAIASTGRLSEHLDVFWTGPDGAVASTWWDAAPNSGWGDHEPFPVAPPASARPGSPVGVVARTSGHLDVFWVTADGSIGSNWWAAEPGFSWADHGPFVAAAPPAPK